MRASPMPAMCMGRMAIAGMNAGIL